jgi:hypothetical protein
MNFLRRPHQQLAAVLAGAISTSVFAAPIAEPALKVSANQRYLVTTAGQPFFYLGDTAWELFHFLNREEADRYLRNRAAKGFTVIQAVIVAETAGIKRPNAYGALAFEEMDARRPNEAYFAHVDWIINRAAELGLYVGVLPTWGRWVGGNDAHRNGEFNNFFNVENAREYGRYLGARYQDKPVIWILGGDRPAEKSAEVWHEMAAGLREKVGKRQLITFHPPGGHSSGDWFHDTSWLDFNILQSGHSPVSANYGMLEKDYARQPVKPCLDSEPAYEYPPHAMPTNRPVGALQVRRNAYWSLFAGALGHTYGAHPIWQMYDGVRKARWDVSTPWHESLDLPGAFQMTHVKALLLSRPFLNRIPDQGLLADDPHGDIRRIQATRDGSPNQNDATYFMAYFPEPRAVRLATSKITAPRLRVWWFNPRDGRVIERGATKNEKIMTFTPPTQGSEDDWVVVVDDAAKNYPPPGTTIE